jgi:hypothetical protein
MIELGKVSQIPVLSKVVANAMYAIQSQNLFDILPTSPTIADFCLDSSGFSGWEVDEYKAYVKIKAEDFRYEYAEITDDSDPDYLLFQLVTTTTGPLGKKQGYPKRTYGRIEREEYRRARQEGPVVTPEQFKAAYEHAYVEGKNSIANALFGRLLIGCPVPETVELGPMRVAAARCIS